jgi:hypothetical protein
LDYGLLGEFEDYMRRIGEEGRARRLQADFGMDNYFSLKIFIKSLI